MLDREMVERRLARLEQTLFKLREISAASWERYSASEALQDRGERNLQVAAQCCIDIASHVVAVQGLGTPESYADVFTMMGQAGLLQQSLVGSLAKMAGFRNILVYEYLEIDPYLVYQHLGQLDDFAQFARAIDDLL